MSAGLKQLLLTGTSGAALCLHSAVQLQTTLLSRFHENNNSSPIKWDDA